MDIPTAIVVGGLAVLAGAGWARHERSQIADTLRDAAHRVRADTTPMETAQYGEAGERFGVWIENRDGSAVLVAWYETPELAAAAGFAVRSAVEQLADRM